MKFLEASNLYSLNKSTYVNLRWIAYIGQISAILTVQFILNFEFNYFYCISIVLFSVLTNLYLQFKTKEVQLNNFFSTIYLSYDIVQLGLLFFLTGGITNPFIYLIIVPAVFSSQYLNILSSIFLSTLIVLILIILTFFSFELPHPGTLHFHAPDYYLYAIPLSLIVGLIFLVYFGLKFGQDSRIRQLAYDKIQELMAKENELLSLGGQAAAAAHSLGTPLSTILLTAKELQKEFGNNQKIKKDLDLLVSQSNRCSEILKKLSLNPNINDEKGYTFDLGIRGTYDKKFAFDSSLFSLIYKDRIGFIQKVFPDGNVKSERGNVGNAQIIGLESLLDFDLNEIFIKNNNIDFNYFINYSFIESKYLKSEEVGITNNSVEFIPKHNLKTGIKFGYKDLILNIQYSYISEQYTDSSNAIQGNLSGVIGQIPSYEIADISISYNFKSISFEAGINNLLDESYFTRRATGYPGPGIIPSPPRNSYLTVEIKL